MNVPQTEFSITDFDNAVSYIQQQTALHPVIAMILGSGLGELADAISNANNIPYSEIPNWPQSTVMGHSGRIVVGELEGQAILAMRGRAHFYEGYGMGRVVFPIRVMQRLGIKTLIVTNAAGGLDPAYHPGDLMLIKDHINLPGLAGNNPLIGPNNDQLGTRFPSMTNAYDRDLRRLVRSVAQESDIRLYEGVYAYLSGPAFETPAEIRMLRMLGAHAVGMSTVPETVVANHAGIRVIGISGITNAAIDDPDSMEGPNHLEVLEAGKTLVPRLTTLIRGILRRLATTG